MNMSTDQSFKHIISRDNPVFKQLKKLADNARERRAEGKTLLDGVHLIEGYCQAFGEPELAGLELIIIPEGKSSREATNLMQTLSEVNTMMLPTLMFAELTPVASSTGILALVTAKILAFACATRKYGICADAGRYPRPG